MKPRYVVRITPADVGRRVSVRARLDDTGQQAAGPRHTDVVGTLEEWAAGWLTIHRRDGSLTRVDERALVAGKVLPDAPPRRG